jgi:hypothetical protein
MLKLKNVFSVGACVVALVLTQSSAYAADNNTQILSVTSAGGTTLAPTRVKCVSCVKNKLKAGVWLIGVYR